MITPPPGYGLAYIDWSQQEIGIAAALYGDPALLSAYESGDCYLAFAKQDNAVPPDANEETHPVERDLYKNCDLGVGYGMAESSGSTDQSPGDCRPPSTTASQGDLPDVLAMGNNAVEPRRSSRQAMDRFRLDSLGPRKRLQPRSLRNFHAQAHGAEMLRLACCLGIENGIEICAPVHDELLICAPVEGLAHDTEQMRVFMAEASRIVLGGFVLWYRESEADLPSGPSRP